MENFSPASRGRGAWNDTLIWIVSDHGEEFWEHDWKWHGASLYEEVTRVVSLVSCPWLVPAGLAISAPGKPPRHALDAV